VRFFGLGVSRKGGSGFPLYLLFRKLHKRMPLQSLTQNLMCINMLF